MYSTCAQAFIARSGMKPYCGQDVGCRFIILEYILQGEEYFVYENPCVDMLVSIADCNGEIFCEASEDCGWFYIEAKYVGIVGIRM